MIHFVKNILRKFWINNIDIRNYIPVSWNLTIISSTFRIYIVLSVFALLFLIIIMRLLLVTSNSYLNQNNIASRNEIHRLNITDRNNNLLAVNLPSSSLYANPKKVIDQELSIKKILTIFPDLDEKKLTALLKSDKSFVWIKKDIAPQEHAKIYNLGLVGFGFEKEQKRIYTYSNLLSHIIGYVGRDLQGLAGIEKHFNDLLVTEESNKKKKLSDKSLQLSIDVRLQNIVSEEIDKTMKKFSAKGAAGIVVDPNSGEILALVSKPDFNPHYPGKAKSEQLFNVATQGVYEMGSGIKALTMAIGLDGGTTSIKDAYNLNYMNVSGFRVQDYHAIQGWQSVPYIFLKSSNIGVGQIILEIGKERLSKYLDNLGIFDRMQIEIPERGRPIVPKYDSWTDLSLITMSYGYAISFSPAHFVQAMIPIMNGGTSYPLTLIKHDKGKSLIGKRILKEKTSIDMRKLMRLVVSKGTGGKSEVSGYYVGGKTGTANIAENGKYNKSRRISSFLGVIPASNPQYMVYIMYIEPKGIKETFGFAGGGWTAAPTVGAIFKRLVALYGMEKLDENSREVEELNNIEYKMQDEK